jgi:hypothetical protein
VRLEIQPDQGLILCPHSDAPTRVNGQITADTALRNGDLIEIGSVRLQFWLTPTRQRGLQWREVLTWAAIAAISLGQVWLIYYLLN